VSQDPAVLCTQGSSGVLLHDDTLLLVDAEGISHSTGLLNRQVGKNLATLTYLTTTIFAWSDADVLNDAFKDVMDCLKLHREEMQLQGSKPDLLYIRRDDHGLDDLTPEGLEAKLAAMPQIAELFGKVRAVSLPVPTKKDVTASLSLSLSLCLWNPNTRTWPRSSGRSFARSMWRWNRTRTSLKVGSSIRQR
jgi:hypothetical protein